MQCQMLPLPCHVQFLPLYFLSFPALYPAAASRPWKWHGGERKLGDSSARAAWPALQANVRVRRSRMVAHDVASPAAGNFDALPQMSGTDAGGVTGPRAATAMRKWEKQSWHERQNFPHVTTLPRTGIRRCRLLPPAPALRSAAATCVDQRQALPPAPRCTMANVNAAHLAELHAVEAQCVLAIAPSPPLKACCREALHLPVPPATSRAPAHAHAPPPQAARGAPGRLRRRSTHPWLGPAAHGCSHRCHRWAPCHGAWHAT